MSQDIEQYSFIPRDLIKKPEKLAPYPDPFDLIAKENQRPYRNFTPLGDSSNFRLAHIADISQNAAHAFHIRQEDAGAVFISKRNFVEGLRGELVPRAILITQEGKKLIKEYPGILKQIDDQVLHQRKPELNSDKGFSGEVQIATFGDNQNCAVKQFYRFQNGSRYEVGGLEQAEAYYHINKQSDLPVRAPQVYFASQDVLVMENIERYVNLKVFLKEHPLFRRKVIDDIYNLHTRLSQLQKEGKIKGTLDLVDERVSDPEDFSQSLGEISLNHVFIESYDDIKQTVRYIVLDLNT